PGDGNPCWGAPRRESVASVQEGLGTANRERGNQHAASPRGGFVHDSRQVHPRCRSRFVITVAVRRFQNDSVSTSRRMRIANDWKSLPAYITGEHKAFGDRPFTN